MHWPALAGFVQPLSGEYAARRSLLEQLPFPTGYGVEIGLLVDALRLVGLDGLAQVDLSRRKHRNQEIGKLGRMSSEILQVAMERLRREGRLTMEPPATQLTQFERSEDEYVLLTLGHGALGAAADEHRRRVHDPLPPGLVKVLYTDLDGTMVGPHGNFFAAADRTPTLTPARALLELHRAGVALVLVSGRTRAQLVEAGAIFGADGFVAELGALVGWDRGRSVEVLPGAMPAAYAGRLPFEVMQEAGLPDALFARWPGRLQWHAPWHAGHEADAMLRGPWTWPRWTAGWPPGAGAG
jgi:hypothetical protein